MDTTPTTGEFLLYQTEDGQSRIQVRLIDDSLWLTQKQLSELYQVSVTSINGHLRTIYEDGELDANRTIRKSRIVAREGKRNVERLVDHYNLEAILHIGYRVRSHRGAQFRRWASEALQSYLVKGFVLDDERFKNGKDDAYFEELLARIRDIRSSEKVFWKKVLDIYATSIDYSPATDAARQFFATVRESFVPLVWLQDADANGLFGADDTPVIFNPSRREYAEQRVHRPALADEVARALVQQRFAYVLGKGASGKTTLALTLAFDAEFGVYRSFYYDLTTSNEEQPDPEKYRALLVGIANQHGREALVIIDNVHLAARLAMGVYHAWRDAGMPVRLLFQGRWTEKLPDSRGRPAVFGEIARSAMRLVVQKQDLVGGGSGCWRGKGKALRGQFLMMCWWLGKSCLRAI